MFYFGESLSFKSLKIYYADSIFSFKLTYFFVLKKEMEVNINSSISYCVFCSNYSDNKSVTICKIKTNYLKLDSHLPNKLLFASMTAFKNDEKCFLFHLKSSFRSQDIQTFVLTLWLCRKKGLIRKIRLILKFMMSQPG